MFVLVVRNNSNPKAIEASYMLAAYLESQGIGFSFIDSSQLYSGIALADTGVDGRMIDLAVVLGGDGTILRTSRLLNGHSVPILGINFGNLGFLANSDEHGVIDLVAMAFAGELIINKRANLQIDVTCEDGTHGASPYYSLNEIAITRGSLGRTIKYSLDISDVHIANVEGDGVIVATATGSTAYALAAGGPIVNPAFDGMIIQPLAPHTLTARAMLTDPSDIVSIDLSKTREGREATLFIDGDMVGLESKLELVEVRRGDDPTTLLYADRNHFYNYAANTFFAE